MTTNDEMIGGQQQRSLFVVTYSGPFGFIKPWTAVRDELTFSQSFLTPSIIEGMRQKLEVAAILRHKLRHSGVSVQQERTQTAGWKVTARQTTRGLSILNRGVLIHPILQLAFLTLEDAKKAATQHLCLCRNEDVVLPVPDIAEVTEAEFEHLPGNELIFGEAQDAFLVGFNRFSSSEAMYGRLSIVQDEKN